MKTRNILFVAFVAVLISGGVVLGVVNQFSDDVLLLDGINLRFGTDTDFEMGESSGDLAVVDGAANAMMTLTDDGTTATLDVPGGTVTAEQLTSTDDITATGDVGAANVTASATVQGEQITSTDDATIADDAAINGGIITSTATDFLINLTGGDFKLTGSDGAIRNYRQTVGDSAWYTYLRNDAAEDILNAAIYITQVDDTDGSEDAGMAFALRAAGSMVYSLLTLSNAGNVGVAGDLTVTGGDIVAGADTTTRGTLTLWDGSGGAAPGYIKIASPNGTVWYLFVEDDGTLKAHTAAPTQNSDGSAVGDQTD